MNASINDIERLIQLLAKLPGLGPRSARRAALYLIKRRESIMDPLAKALDAAASSIQTCSTCGNVDTVDPCSICTDPKRPDDTLCVVEDVADLWALERTTLIKGRYHVLGGTLSVLDGIGPEDLNIPKLISRVKENNVTEVILATNATVDGQTTAHYIADRLKDTGTRVSGLAHGVPVGGELDYLDEGTLSAAFKARRTVGE
ncbi:MAG: recombination mediator RecR [Rhodospirillales bacterium]|jgi:recombination protein RecR